MFSTSERVDWEPDLSLTSCCKGWSTWTTAAAPCRMHDEQGSPWTETNRSKQNMHRNDGAAAAGPAISLWSFISALACCACNSRHGAYLICVARISSSCLPLARVLSDSPGLLLTFPRDVLGFFCWLRSDCPDFVNTLMKCFASLAGCLAPPAPAGAPNRTVPR